VSTARAPTEKSVPSCSPPTVLASEGARSSEATDGVEGVKVFPVTMTAPVRIVIQARPGSSREAVSWDRWRSAWVVHVREKAERGRANEAILTALGRWLSVDPKALRWVRAGKRTRKIAEVEGLSASEVKRRLDGASRES
jgi:uncharacterized protein YggU (UPF0235/DUF167 family)